jgi:large repetitive protein
MYAGRLENLMKTILSRLTVLFTLCCAGASHALAGPGAKVIALPLAATASGTISIAGQEDLFTFTGAVGQRLYYDTLDVDNENLSIQLVAPSGVLVGLPGSSTYQEVPPFYLVEAGIYTLKIDGVGDATGQYKFRMLDAGAASSVTTGPTNSVTLNTSSQTELFRFSGTAGQRIYLQSISADTNSATWQLINPANVTVASGLIDSDLGTNLLVTSGTYLIVVAGTVQAGPALHFKFRLTDVSEPAVAPSGFGLVHTGTIAAGETNTFTYTASAGTVVYFDSLVAQGSAGIVDLLTDPLRDAVINSDATYDSAPAFLAHSGVYTLQMVGTSGGAYSFRLLNLTSGSSTLTIANTNLGTLSPGFRADPYIFQGSPGQRIFYDVFNTNNSGGYWGLYSPSLGAPLSYQNSAVDFGTIALTEPGTYYLIQAGNTADPTLNYSFRLLDLAEAPALPLALNAFVTNTIDPGNQTVLYRFTGTAGQRLFFDGLGADSGANWNLLDPLNSLVGSANITGDFTVTLSKSGTYALEVLGNASAPVQYAFRVLTPVATNFALTLGATTTGTLTSVGEEGYYTFTGTAGQRLFYDSLQNDIANIQVRLLDPHGNAVYLYQGVNAETAPFTLAESGLYSLVVGGASDALGLYSFRLIDLNQAPDLPITYNTVYTGSNSMPLSASIFRFNGSAGQQVFFDSQFYDTASWWVYGVDNTLLAGAAIGNDFELTLPKTGTYQLLLESSYTNAFSYAFRLLNPNTNTLPLTLNTVVSNTFNDAGGELHFTFAGAPGQHLYYDGLQVDANATASLLSPNGSQLWSIGSGSDSPLITLTDPGTYTLILHNHADYASTNWFQFLDVANQPSISLGSAVTGQLNPQSQARLYRFVSVGGQKIHLQSLTTNAAPAYWTLYGPDNSSMASANIAGDAGDVYLAAAGTYVVVVQGAGPGTGTVDYQFVLLDASCTPPPGLVTWWPANGDASDPVGGNNGTLQNGATYAPGEVGQAFSLDGVSASVLIPNSSSLNPTGPFSVEAWIKAKPQQLSPDSQFLIVDKSHGFTDNTGWGLQGNSDGTVAFFYGTGSGFPLVSTTNSVLDDQWHHLAGVFTGSKIQIFEDGVLHSSLSQAALPANNQRSVEIGASWGGGTPTRFFHGLIDEVSYYNQALSSNDIAAIYASGSAGKCIGAASGFGSYSGTIAPNTTNFVYFTARAGTHIYLDSLTNNSSAYVALIAPDGASVFANVSAASAPYETGMYILPTSGTYSLQVTALGGGDYNFRILNLDTDAIPAVFGTNYSGPLTMPFQTVAYRFTATAGQRLLYDGLEGDNEPVYMELRSPSGAYVPNMGYFAYSYYYGSYNADGDYGLATLTESGTYFLFIGSGVATTNHYSFRLLDVNQAPAVQTSLGVTNGSGLVPVPPSSLSVTGSYVNLSLRALDDPDWRASQTIAGTRRDPAINFSVTNWGSQASVGLSGGADTNWQNFSVQWDGTVTVTNPNTHLYLLSGDGSRMWLDADKDGVFSPGEVLSNGWGSAQFATPGPASPPLLPGTYHIRIQYEDGTEPATMVLLWDNGYSLAPFEAKAFRFQAPAAPLFFQSFQTANASWSHFRPAYDYPNASANNLQDFESSSDQPGTNLVILYNSSALPQPYSFRIIPPQPLTNSLTVGNAYSAVLSAGQDYYYTFTGTTGQRIYYDALDQNLGYATLSLIAPSGTFLVNGAPDGAGQGPFTLTESGAYSLVLHNHLGTPQNWSFRLLDVATQPFVILDATNNVTENLGTTASLFQFNTIAHLRLFMDVLSTTASYPYSSWTLYGPNGTVAQLLGSAGLWYDGDFVVNDPPQTGTYLLVINNNYDTNSYNFSFRIVPGNHPPTLAAIPNQAVSELVPFAYTNSASDPEIDNQHLAFTLDPGAPAGLAIDPVTGVMSWTPTEAQGPGLYPVTVRVTDDGVPPLSDAKSFNMQVNEINVAPVLSVHAKTTSAE